MHKLLIATLVVLSTAALAAPLETVTLDVQNMTCEVCPITVKKSLKKVSGVNAAQVDFDRKTVTVTYDPDQVRPDVLIRATTNAGYPSTVQK